MSLIYLANAQQAIDILQNGLKAQQAIVAAMDQLWTNILNSPLFTVMADLGRLFAVGLMALLILNVVKELLQDEKSFPPYEKIIWLAIVIALLTNQGALTRELTLALRGLINGINEFVLQQTLAEGGDLFQAFQQATSQVGLQNWFNQQLQQCQAIPDPQQKKACIDGAMQTANQIANNLPQNPGINLNPLSAIGSILETSMQGWLIAFGLAFQWAVEVVWLLMGLAAPLAVGGTLLPVTQKSLYSWLIGFYSVGLCKLFFNLLVGLLAMVQIQAKTTNTLVFSIAIGILSPILAVTLAAGGGMATFSSLATLGGMAGARLGASAAGAGMGALRSLGRMTGHPVARRTAGTRAAIGNQIPRSVRDYAKQRYKDATTPLFKR
jgi:hypothetical protein